MPAFRHQAKTFSGEKATKNCIINTASSKQALCASASCFVVLLLRLLNVLHIHHDIWYTMMLVTISHCWSIQKLRLD